MPAEWEPQDAVWLSWPHNRADWPGKFGPIPWAFAEMIRHIAANERVGLLVKDEVKRREAADALEDVGVDPARVTLLPVATNRGWLRDCGPIFVQRSDGEPSLASRRTGADAFGYGETAVNAASSPPPLRGGLGGGQSVPPSTSMASASSLVALDWRFNAWAKYSNWQKDNAVPEGIAQHLGVERVQPVWPLAGGKQKRVVLEGGAIDVNGAGTLLTTEECLLSPVQCRNPGFSRDDYEACLAHWLGARHVIWLNEGIVGDDTHGHVDDLARFVNPTTVVTVTERDAKDDNHARLTENLRRLRAATDQDGRPLDIVELPMPRPLFFEGQRLPASYANFLIVNGAVLVPTFNDPNDRLALNLLAECFPDREVIGLSAVDLVWGLGTIHCLTQQMPSQGIE